MYASPVAISLAPETQPLLASDVVVKFLEDALDSARKGELRAVMLVAEHSDGYTSGSWACGKYHSKVMLLGALHLAGHRLARSLDEE